MSRPPDNQPSPSSSPRPTDPFELWRQIYETNERAWNAVLERTVNNPAFAESSGKILETFLSAQKTVRDNMRSYLEQINLPTREDIARLGELIVSLEEKVDQLDDRLANLERSVTAATTALAKTGATTSTAANPSTGRGSTRSVKD
jgi:polyhydroxyalkanoic acid synthase PhaR subunit